MRSISARIILAFFSVIATFGITTAVILLYLGEFGTEIGVVKTGYLPLALGSKDFASRQDDLRSYLAEDLRAEPTSKSAVRSLARYRRERDKTLKATQNVLDTMGEVPQRHEKRLHEASSQLTAIREAIEQTGGNYTVILALPPITSPSEAGSLAKSEQALLALIDQENGIGTRAQKLADFLKSLVTKSASNLEDNEKTLRWYTALWAGGAITLAILLTIWVAIALAPLRRLRDAAAKIAAGEYGNRIVEKGPKEVADLAREFNAMGRAVQDREHELVRSERLAAVGKMAQLITHEIRNPLSSIGLNTELLQEELQRLQPNEEVNELCAAIHREVDRLTAITEDYLQMGRLPKPTLRSEDIVALTKSVVDFVRGDLLNRGCEIRYACNSVTPLIGSIDADQLRQCLLNLIRNGAEAAAQLESPCVEVVITKHGDDAQILVSDNGPGVAEEDRAKIFDPFFSTKKGGSGLGLALTQQIIHDHGGVLTLESTAPVGARFAISLPLGSQ